jgi:hypothetical protein
MRVSIAADGFRSDDRYLLTPVGKGTRLEYTSETRLGGLLRLMSPLVTRQMRARARRDLGALKHEIEAGS